MHLKNACKSFFFFFLSIFFDFEDLLLKQAIKIRLKKKIKIRNKVCQTLSVTLTLDKAHDSSQNL